MQFGISVLFISIYLICKQNKIAIILKYCVEVLIVCEWIGPGYASINSEKNVFIPIINKTEITNYIN